jgi:hypothetical protein
MENLDVERVHAHHTGRGWLDLVLGISAVFISFVSLFLAIENGRAMERLVQANSWPSVQFTFSTANDDGTTHVHFDIANKGIGPARIESLEMSYKGASVKDARALLNAMLNRTTLPRQPVIGVSDIVSQVLASKESIRYIDFIPGDFSPEDNAVLRETAPKANFRACYCSVFDECWMADTTKVRPTKVKACPVLPST